MRILCIFEENLFAFQYEGLQTNEYDRLLGLWTDVNYLHNYAKKNDVLDIKTFVQNRLKDAEQIEDTLEQIVNQGTNLSQYFRPLNNSEYGAHQLSMQKGKIYRNGLRLYAIRIDDNCFAITGGAIKMSHAMKDHKDTEEELVKLERARDYLREEGIVDNVGFYELVDEQE